MDIKETGVHKDPNIAVHGIRSLDSGEGVGETTEEATEDDIKDKVDPGRKPKTTEAILPTLIKLES